VHSNFAHKDVKPTAMPTLPTIA